MLIISDDFKNSVSATEREMKGYVEVTYTSSEAKENASVTNYPDILKIGDNWLDASEIIDDDRKGNNYASLENNYFKLDGTFVLPNNVANKNPGIGYVSNKIFEEDSEISFTPFRISTSFDNDKTINGLTMYFQNNNPLDLEVEVYSGQSYETFDIDDMEVSDIGVVTLMFSERNVSFVNIIVKDVLYPDRRLRLQEVDFGLSKIYEGDELVSFKTIEQIDRFNDTIPENEIEVTIGDFKGNFDFRNTKGITKYLDNNVLIKPYVGVVTENSGVQYCLKGTYWLQSYEYNGKEAILKAKDIYSKLQEKDFNKNYVIIDGRSYHEEMSIADHLRFKADKWGVTINDLHLPQYEINNMIDDTYSRIDTKVNNLQKLAIVGGGTFNSDRYGNVVYKSLYDENNTNITNKYINLDNMKDFPSIEIKQPIKSIIVNETVVKYDSAGTLETFYTNKFYYVGDVYLYIDAEDWKTMEKPTLTNATLLTSSWSVDPTEPEGEQGFYGTIDDTYAFMKIRCNGNVTVSVKGFSNSSTTNPNVKNLQENGSDITITNDYIATSGVKDIRNVSSNIVNFNASHRNKYSASLTYNGDPTLECGDFIRIQSKYDNEIYDKVIITKIQSEFKGSYNETIEGDIIE